MTDEAEVNLEDYEEIVNPVLDHLAICHKIQGYSANNWGDKPLLTKAANGDEEVLQQLRKSLRQVRVEMSMEEFLRKFFHVYYDDATLLAKILGYETEGDSWAEEYADEKSSMITLLKSIKTEKDFFNLEYEDQDKITSLQSKFEKGLLSGISSECTNDDLQKSNNNVVNSDSNQEENDKKMTTDVEALKKQVADFQAMLKAKDDEIAAAKEEANAILEKQKTDSLMLKAEKVDLIEDKEAFVSLMKSADERVVESVFGLLEKAGKEITELKAKTEEMDLMTKQLSDSVDISFSASEDGKSYDQRTAERLAKKYSKEGDK